MENFPDAFSGLYLVTDGLFRFLQNLQWKYIVQVLEFYCGLSKIHTNDKDWLKIYSHIYTLLQDVLQVFNLWLSCYSVAFHHNFYCSFTDTTSSSECLKKL